MKRRTYSSDNANRRGASLLVFSSHEGDKDRTFYPILVVLSMQRKLLDKSTRPVTEPSDLFSSSSLHLDVLLPMISLRSFSLSMSKFFTLFRS